MLNVFIINNDIHNQDKYFLAICPPNCKFKPSLVLQTVKMCCINRRRCLILVEASTVYVQCAVSGDIDWKQWVKVVWGTICNKITYFQFFRNEALLYSKPWD